MHQSNDYYNQYDEFIDYVLVNQLGSIEKNVSLKNYCTIKIGGNGFCLFKPNSIQSLHLAYQFILKYQLDYFMIGNGSNLLISDEYHQIIFINLKTLNHTKIYQDNLILEAGVSIPIVSKNMSRLGYTGLEFLAGIPGTVGGAIYMNAGAYGFSMSDILESVSYLDEFGNLCEMVDLKNKGFDYRTSPFQKRNVIIVACKIKLRSASNQTLPIKVYMENLRRKRTTQPVQLCSAGCAFKNPKQSPAWKLIEGANCSNLIIGDAKVSNLHHNFLINQGNATFNDMYQLLNLIKAKVYEKYNIELVPEWCIIN